MKWRRWLGWLTPEESWQEVYRRVEAQVTVALRDWWGYRMDWMEIDGLILKVIDRMLARRQVWRV